MKKSSINDFVREKLRSLRISRNKGVSELAADAGIPVSSYASLENGAYRITLDNLFRILGALDANIEDVWPGESVGAQVLDDSLYFRRIQEFRLAEVISLADAEGGGLFKLGGDRASVLMSLHLSDFLIDRILLSLQEKREYRDGQWFRKDFNGNSYYLFLKAESCPGFVATLIRNYMINWSAFFQSRA